MSLLQPSQRPLRNRESRDLNVGTLEYLKQLLRLKLPQPLSYMKDMFQMSELFPLAIVIVRK